MESLIIFITIFISGYLVCLGSDWRDRSSKVCMIVGLILGGSLAAYLLSYYLRTYVNENLRSTEGCAEWYLDKMHQYASDGEIKDFKEFKRCMNEWSKELNDDEWEVFYETVANWEESNPYKVQDIQSFTDKYDL